MKIELVRNKFDCFYKLIINDEDKVRMGEKPVCQMCTGFIEVPFYICETNKKWFCKECQLKAEPKEPLCPFELTEDEHTHFCIEKVVELKM